MGKRNFRKKNYSADRDASADWDASFVAPMQASVPARMGGMRLDQALAQLFPQYSRNRLQAWLAAGHIKVEGRHAASRQPVTGASASRSRRRPRRRRRRARRRCR